MKQPEADCVAAALVRLFMESPRPGNRHMIWLRFVDGGFICGKS
jgi:hypothetical protein